MVYPKIRYRSERHVWPQANPLHYSQQRLKLHVQTDYSMIAQLLDCTP